MHVEAEYSGFI